MKKDITRNRRNQKQCLRMRSKLILTYGMIALLTSIIIAGMISYEFSKRQREMIGNYNAQILQQLNLNIDHYFDYLKKQLRSLSHQTEVIAYFEISDQTDSSVRERLDAKYAVQEMLYLVAGNNGMISEICLFPKEGSSYITTEEPYVTHRFSTEDDWYVELNASDETDVIYLIVDNEGELYRYCYARKVYDDETGDVIGIVSIGCDISILQAFAEKYDFGQQGILKLYNDDGTIIINNTDESAYGTALAQYKASQTGAYEESIAGERTLINAYYSTVTEWTVMSGIPVSYIMRNTGWLSRTVTIITLSSLIGIIILSIAISSSISGPINTLVSNMDKVNGNELNFPIPVSRNDEIGRLTESFNQMQERLDDMIKTVYQADILQKETELRALQAQINPHFLYNALESIKTLAVLNDDSEVSDAIVQFGKYLRYAINEKNSLVALPEELAHVRRYIGIMKMYNKRIRFTENIQIPVENFIIIKMVLQPVVENCYIHAFPQKRSGEILLRITRDGSDLLIQVLDDGVGLSVKAVNLGCFTEQSDGHTGIGLSNIHERIRLRFGAPYGIEICSRPSGGTCTTIRFPGKGIEDI